MTFLMIVYIKNFCQIKPNKKNHPKVYCHGKKPLIKLPSREGFPQRAVNI